MAAAADADASPQERAEMLMEIAMGLQARPQSAQQLVDAIGLYERALEVAPAEAALLQARIGARMGTALQALPDADAPGLERALQCFQAAIVTLQHLGRPEEVAEAELNQGLVLQSLSAIGRARVTDAIGAYQRALRTFTREAWPQEYSVLHNNLGNALQYASSSHVLENNLRALAAYDEALRVRNPRDTPIEYANTIANKANVLRNLVPDPARASLGGGLTDPLTDALALVREAQALFERFGDAAKAALMREAAGEIEAERAQRRHALN